MDKPEVKEYQEYCPPGVKRVIASGGSAWIGEVYVTTVLEYPHAPEDTDTSRLETERRLLEIVGPHEHIIKVKRCTDNRWLYLERAINGNLDDYYLRPAHPHPPPSLEQRLTWCQEIAEAVTWVHSRGVIHCDIQPRNILLDEMLRAKLADFQGKHLSEDGTVLLEGWSGEPCRFYCPRRDPFDADVQTDLFALGCTIYFIMMGHDMFPDIADGDNAWFEKVEHRFATQQFPEDKHACSDITRKCWHKE
ncbi:kinase-like protein [Aspergillus neoniger CBS 115656]|uniref:non-specific serine/threonine protein kinase n=1 Tax=Aspergillus neoniger (strain CBS 115656) TaxID=1448310 RepID=A0A318Z451_ASPNB|nr:kinase-like protein [Aspergillus neoniger CBS 115656]PYH39693.1 kinase-like protein [Aspergillus neoniger CBS 115656]